MTRSQLASELMRVAKLQIGDITRAVKQGEKAIALNEVRDMAKRLNLLADALTFKQENAHGPIRAINSADLRS